MQDTIYKQATGFVAILLIAILVAPAAFAFGATPPAASAAKVTKTLQKLKTQLAVLRQQVGALEGQNGAPRTPSGPAGGDLTGAYPNPLVGPNAIGAAEIQNNAVGSDELQNESVGGEKVKLNTLTGLNVIDNTIDVGDIANNAIIGSKIFDGSVGAADLATDSVGTAELQVVTATVSAGKTISAAGGPQNVSVTCPDSRTLIAGGYAWQEDEGNSIIASAPSEANPRTTWVVRGMVDTGSNNLFAWATCLPS